MRHYFNVSLSPTIIYLLLIIFINGNVKADVNNSTNNNNNPGCSMRDVMSCVVQLKSYNVPIDTNMMNVVFNVSTEAKLVHVCRAYNNAMPCFKQRLATCANEKQRIRLAEVNRLLLFICAPFSLQRQKTLLKVGKCIGEVLNHPVEPNCPSTKHRFGHKLRLCRYNCESNDVVCQMRVRMSELAVCSVIAIEKQCGRQAADFYAYMQTAIIGEEFPIQCKYDFAADKIRNILNSQEFVSNEEAVIASTLNTPSHQHQQFVVQELVLPKSEALKKASNESSDAAVSNENISSPQNSKTSSSYNYTRKELKIFQNERKKTWDKTSEEKNDSEEIPKKEKTKNVRTRNFSKLFRPSKFAEVNLKKYQPPENTVIVQLFPSLEDFDNNKTSNEKSNERLPAFLHGARPIPDSSMARSIILPKTSYLSKESAASKERIIKAEEKSKSMEAETTQQMLAAVREIYKPNIGAASKSVTTTTSEPTTSSTTTSTTTTTTEAPSPTSTTTTMPPPLIFTFSDLIPITTPPRNVIIQTTPNNNFIPWYYNTINNKHQQQQQNNDTATMMMVTSNPVFPYFNPKTLSSLPKQPQMLIDPYYSQPINTFDPNQFAENFVSRINADPQLRGMLTTTTTPTITPSASDDIAKLLNMPDFKEKADTILSTAIDVLKPHNKYQQPFADMPDSGSMSQMHSMPNMPHQQQQHSHHNKNASGAFSDLMETIKKISPTVLDNIRDKLNSLGHN